MPAERSQSSERHTMAIPARLDRLGDVRDFVDRTAREAGFGDADRYQMKMAVNEAVTNAIRHGSESAEDEVTIEISEHEDDRLDFRVADTGVFVHRFELHRPLAERGRGLAFIAELMEGLEIRPEYEGTTIWFSKRSSPSPGSPSA
jgi:serine/threonine-protein kinase RsbW